MPWKRGWLFGLLLVLGGIAAGAAEINKAVPGDFAATVTVRIVDVDAVATDSSGRPVRDLKPADFRLKVDGHEVPIEYFTEVLQGEEKSGQASAAPSAAPVKVGTSYLLFIDDYFSIDTQRNRVLDRLEQDLRLGPEDRVAVVVYNGRPSLLTNWTGDIDRVRQILDQVKKRSVRRISLVWNPGVEGAQAAASVAMRGLPPPPGRKVFLLVSGGWPEVVAHSEISRGDLSPFISQIPRDKLFEPVADTANLLGYTIYFMEIPGVYNTLDVVSPPELFGDRLTLVGLDNLGPYQNVWAVARRTGGAAMLYSTRGNILARVEEDSGSYYSLAFSPEWHGDGRKHHIEVEVRKPGIRVRSRDGYFDMTPRMQAVMKSESQLLFGVTTSIQATAGKPEWGGLGAINLPVTLEVPARALTVRPAAGGYEVRATVAATSVDGWGYTQRQKDRPVALTLPKKPGPDDLIPFTVTYNLNTQGQHLRLYVLDDGGAGVSRSELYWDWHPRVRED
jgi:VWFA-related protein